MIMKHIDIVPVHESHHPPDLFFSISIMVSFLYKQAQDNYLLNYQKMQSYQNHRDLCCVTYQVTFCRSPNNPCIKKEPTLMIPDPQIWIYEKARERMVKRI